MPHKRKQLDFKDKDLWYLVGLITTDGNLSSDGRHTSITSKEYDYLEKLKLALGLENRIGKKLNGKHMISYQIQIANKGFYEFLLSIGLTPKKSLTLGDLKIPDPCFPDFMRGVIDGDGCIRSWIHPSNKKEQWSLRVYSAAPKFTSWLRESIKRNLLVEGKVHPDKRARTSVIKFGKLAAKRILSECYYDGCLGLDRKMKLARRCCLSKIGWSKSKTVLGVA